MLLNPENCWWNNIFLRQIFQEKRAGIFLALLFFKNTMSSNAIQQKIFFILK